MKGVEKYGQRHDFKTLSFKIKCATVYYMSSVSVYIVYLDFHLIDMGIIT
jgi:hypothetical protein